MTYYILLHRETNLVMPLFPSNRGYTNWDPHEEAYLRATIGPRIGEVPRLFATRTGAVQARSKWAEGVFRAFYDSSTGDGGINVSQPKTPRSVDDLDIVAVELVFDPAEQEARNEEAD